MLSAEPSVAAAAVVGSTTTSWARCRWPTWCSHGVTGDGVAEAAGVVVGRIQDPLRPQFLARPKRPVAFHVVDRLPAGATGKVRRTMIDPGAAIYSLLAG